MQQKFIENQAFMVAHTEMYGLHLNSTLATDQSILSWVFKIIYYIFL